MFDWSVVEIGWSTGVPAMALHLTKDERERISQMHFAGLSHAQIGRSLGRHRGTIGRELARNSVAGRYAAHVAQDLADERRRTRPRVSKVERTQTNAAVRRGLARRWSPDQIAGRLRREFPHQPWRWVSRMSSYRWIARSPDRAHWERCLRFGSRRTGPERRGTLKATADIAHRPEIGDQLRRYGDWEGDTIVGRLRRGGLVTLVERQSGFARVGLVRQLRSRTVTRAMERLAEDLPERLRQTRTLDHGKEFAGHRTIARRTGLAIDFARPYPAWERGRNEHFNGLVRQYFPKGTDFARIGAGAVPHVLDQLNDRPRQRLGYRTPREVLSQYFPVAIEM
jgi:IS30 family transposase